jgi:hypothetical protein
MQVTLISLSPPRVKGTFCNNDCPDAKYGSCCHPESCSLKEWELSDYSEFLLFKKWQSLDGVDKPFKDWLIGQTLTVEIKDNKAWIV